MISVSAPLPPVQPSQTSNATPGLPSRLCFYGKGYDISFCEGSSSAIDLPSELCSSVDIFNEELFNGIPSTFEKPKSHLQVLRDLASMHEDRMTPTELSECEHMLARAKADYVNHEGDSELGHDREIVKEQEREKDEQRGMQ